MTSAQPFSGDEKSIHLFCFGDSIAFGAWDTKGGWVERLKRHVHGKSMGSQLRYWGCVSSLGICGETSAGMLKRISPELAARVWPKEDPIVLIATGINDSAIVGPDHAPQVALGDYEEHLARILECTKKRAQKIACVGMTPVIDSETNPTKWDDTAFYKDVLVEQYDTVARSVCSAQTIPYIPLRELFVAHDDMQGLFFDGLHPNDDGHALIAEVVIERLEEWGWV